MYVEGLTLLARAGLGRAIRMCSLWRHSRHRVAWCAGPDSARLGQEDRGKGNATELVLSCMRPAASGRAVSFALASRYRIIICSLRIPLVHFFMYARTVEMPRGIALIEQRVRSLHNSVGLATSLVTGPVIDHLAARLFLLFGKPIPPACSFHLHGFTSLAKGFLCVRTLVPRFRRC